MNATECAQCIFKGSFTVLPSPDYINTTTIWIVIVSVVLACLFQALLRSFQKDMELEQTDLSVLRRRLDTNFHVVSNLIDRVDRRLTRIELSQNNNRFQ